MISAPSFGEPVAPEVLEEARAVNAQVERMLASQPSVHTVPVAKTRAARLEGRGAFPPPVYLPEARDLEIPGRDGKIRLRVIRPEGEVRGVYLHIHGGGWALGAANMQDVGLMAFAQATKLCVASVDYRLAPENPYPAGPDDCEDAARWLIEHGATALNAPDRFVIGGESAGGNLAAVTLLRLRDRHGIKGAFRGANLVFGAFDLARTPSQRSWGDRNLILSGPIMEFFAQSYLPGLDEEARRAPDISPLYADLRDMPPALFTVGTLDPLLDDTLFMDARWRAAGNAAELRVWPEGIHGFNSFPIALAKAANARQMAFLAAAVG